MPANPFPRLRLPFALLSAFVLLGAAPPRASPPAESAAAFEKGMGLLHEGRYKEALDAFEKANDLAGGRCGPCLLGISRTHIATRNWKRAASSARAAITVLDSPELLALAYNQLGVALTGAERKDWEGAEEAFRKAVELAADEIPIARYNLAEALMARKRYPAAAEAARAYLASTPGGEAARAARIVVCHARLEGNLPPPVFDASPAAGEPMKVGEEVTRPEKIGGPAPAYTPQARVEGVRGIVLIEAIIDEEGCIRDPRLLKEAHPDLGNAAMAAVRYWVFLPAKYEGRPVKVYYTLSVNFDIQIERP